MSTQIYSRTAHWLKRHVPEALSLRIYSRTAHWLRRYVPEALSLRIYSRTAHWLRRYVPEARLFSVTRYATQERAGTVHLQAVSVPEVRHCAIYC